jgi:uncharacterized protein YgiM (DUF1202 family)
MKTAMLCIIVLLLTACVSLDMPAQTETPIQPTATVPQPTATQTATVTTCTVTAEALNVRSGPGIEHPVTGWLRAGNAVTILDQRGAWLLTRAGWIHSNYCEVTK